jgi:restriction endonuclease Mrr
MAIIAGHRPSQATGYGEAIHRWQSIATAGSQSNCSDNRVDYFVAIARLSAERFYVQTNAQSAPYAPRKGGSMLESS